VDRLSARALACKRFTYAIFVLDLKLVKWEKVDQSTDYTDFTERVSA